MADIDFFTLLNLLQTEHPDIASIIWKPGVFDVAKQMMQAEVDGKPWTQDQVNAAITATPYFQQTNANTRSWDVLVATDPATAYQKMQTVRNTVEDLQRQLGVTLDTSGGFGSQSWQFYTNAIRNGWDANEIKYQMLALAGQPQAGGVVGSNAAQIRSAANDYGVPLSDSAVMDWATKVTQGAMDMQGVQGYLIEQAKSLFPALSTALDQGITVKQYAAPYLQLAQQELDINPSDINLTDQKWMAALNQVDPKTGQRVSMSLDSWLAKLRSDPAYGYDTTAQGRQSATTLATALQQKFGAAA